MFLYNNKLYLLIFLCVPTANTDRTHTIKNKNKTLLNIEIMGAFLAPLLVISGAPLYFFGAVLTFALMRFRRRVSSCFTFKNSGK